MKTVGVAELKNRLSYYLRCVEQFGALSNRSARHRQHERGVSCREAAPIRGVLTIPRSNGSVPVSNIGH